MNKRMLISILLYIIAPIAFYIYSYLLLAVVATQIIFIAKQKINKGSCFLILMLIATMYSGITFIGLRLYDWITIIAFLMMLFTKKGKVKISNRLVPLICVILINMFTHGMDGSQVLESVRYIISIALVLVILNERIVFKEIAPHILLLCFANLYNAIAIYLIQITGHLVNIESSFFSTNFYIFENEMRLNGFFSDPNKYMVFCFALLFIIELFIESKKVRRIGIILSCVASVISMSRTALICIVVYVGAKLSFEMKKKSQGLFVITVLIITSIGLLMIVFPDTLNNLISLAYTSSAKLLGRDHTLTINSSLQSDNRTIIWNLANEYIAEKPILGHGWLAYEELLPYPTHNTIFSILLDGGIITLIAYIYTFIPLFISKRWDVSIACVVIPSLLLDLGNYRMWFLLLGLVIKYSNGGRKIHNERIDYSNKKVGA